MKVAQQKLKTEKLKDFFTWSRAVWTNSRGNPLEFHNRPYLIDIYRDQHPNVVYTKAAQMGLSERLLAEAVWVCDQLGMNFLYVFPTASHLEEFVQGRLDPVLMNSDYFIDRMGSVSAKTKDVDKLGLKRIGKGFLYFRGSQNEKQIISVDGDAVCLDERDRFTQENVPYIDKRTLNSKLRWRREASTPTLPGMGIHKSYMESDQRVWEIECRSCGLWQELDFFKSVDFVACIIRCLKCKKEVDRLSDGRWRPQFPGRETHGYKISGLLNPNRSVRELVNEYNKAKVAGFSDLQQFFNQVLGLPYDVAGQSLSVKELDECKKNYYIPAREASNCYAGVDVGLKHHVVILQKLSETNYRLVWAGTVDTFLGPINSIESVLLNYDIKTLVIDKRPETSKVKELIEAYPKEVYAAEYPNSKFNVQEYSRWDDIKHELQVDRTISIDYLVSDVQNKRVELPQNIQTVPDFYEHLRASVRITEKNPKTGVETSRWVEKGPDHFLHAFNYARMAQTRGVLGEALLNYYAHPKSMGAPDFMDWLRINGQRLDQK